MTPRHAFTVVAAVRDGCLPDMQRIVERIAADARGNPLCPFGRMETVHYARWVLLEAVAPLDGKEPLPAELVFTTVYDGSLDTHIDELLRHGRAGIDALYTMCEGYPAPGNRTDSARGTYLRDCRVPTAAIYGAHDGRSLARIRLEHRLWRFLDGIVDARRADWIAGKASPEDIRQQLLRAVRAQEEFAEAPRYAADSTTWPPRRIAGFVLIAIATVAALTILRARAKPISSEIYGWSAGNRQNSDTSESALCWCSQPTGLSCTARADIGAPSSGPIGRVFINPSVSSQAG